MFNACPSINLFIICLNICFIFLNSCMQFGENPKGKHLEIIKDSPNYSVEDEKFVNRKEIINLGFWDDPAAWFSNNMILNLIEFTVLVSDHTHEDLQL